MTPILNNRLFFLILFFIIINTINGYYTNQRIDIEDQSTIDNDLALHNRIDIRSVLWPKICFKTLLKRNYNEYPYGDYQQHEYYKHIIKRSPRKCYPFDTV
ncbi:unnamed protein product [Rotaria sp. Silwood1]|nr:unnamed protein product [Rotaria sp. Silwood1]CAF1256243.1 unnamed protein product [Rotaria sp. Silwood1]CAF4638192.1 unnamed protein product [Rotaria sp. Silwood1]